MRLFRFVIPVALIALAVLASGASAFTFKPNKLNDHAPNGCTKKDCTLREAINKANSTPGKDLVVPKGGKTYKLKQAGANEDMNATGDLDILGTLRIKAKGKRATVNAKGIDRVFHIPATGNSAQLVNLVIKGGDLGGDTSPTAVGGGVLNEGSGTLSVVKSVVTQNDADIAGAAGGGGLGGIGTGEIKVAKTTVTRNISSRGGGLYTNAAATIVGSTISRNESTGTGGGLKAESGLTVRNSTVYGNKATNDGGGISALANSTLNDVTVVKNKAGGTGGGIDSAGTTTISNSLIAHNKLTGMSVGGPDCAGTFTSAGHNLLSDDTGCMGFTGAGDIVRPHPKLGKLARNGGPTKTVALKAGSPAIGNGGKNSSEPRDQRGHKRDHHPDIGAFER